jgi:2-C-methyl-D-erythritol 4-phosphate cytidylyltransferase
MKCMSENPLATSSHIAILLLGGLGTRFGSSKPKQFLPMGGQPLCLYGAKVLESSPVVDFIVYVVPDGYTKNFALILANAGHAKPSVIIVGGATRQESGHLAIQYLLAHGAKSDASVLLQDGDRPRLIERYLVENFANAEAYGASVTAIPATDSVAICKEKGILDGYIPRQEVYLLQTPQAFKIALLAEAMELAEKSGRSYTDDGSLVLAMKGVNPHLVLGDKRNIKITTKKDQDDFEEGQG